MESKTSSYWFRGLLSVPPYASGYQSLIIRSSRFLVNLVVGFEAYLVGGCVRDLLLNRVPKDFDVITTAALTQVVLLS